MLIHPVIQHLNSVITVTLQANFVGDSTDVADQARISAYGDPQINLAGSFSDGASTPFLFSFPVANYSVGLVTGMLNTPVRFMTQLPITPVGQIPVAQGPLDCITSNPVAAATTWVTSMDTRIQAALTTLRAKTPAQLTTLPDATV